MFYTAKYCITIVRNYFLSIHTVKPAENITTFGPVEKLFVIVL